MPGHLHTVDVDQLEPGKIAQRSRHLQGRDVLAFPAEGVTDAVDEVQVAVFVITQQVARTPIGIPLAQDIAADLAVGCLGRGVTLEAAAADLRVVDDQAQGFTHFTHFAKLVKAVLVAWVAVGFNVIAHQAQVALVPERYAPAGAHIVVDVDHVGIGLGRTPALEHLDRPETLHPVLPGFTRQPGAEHAAQAMVAFAGRLGLVEQVAADLADVLEHADAVLAHVLPEFADAELAPHHDRRTGFQRG
ncbi:hypothetical protein D3C80_1279600 [compost metagenome]